MHGSFLLVWLVGCLLFWVPTLVILESVPGRDVPKTILYTGTLYLIEIDRWLVRLLPYYCIETNAIQ